MFSEIIESRGVYGDTSRLKLVVWDGLTEQSDAVYSAAKAGLFPVNGRDRQKHPEIQCGEQTSLELRGRGSWFGKEGLDTIDEVRQSDREPWKHGLEVIDRMLSSMQGHKLPLPKSLKRRQVWSEEPDGELDFDRYRSAQPAWRTCAKRDMTGPRVITIAIAVGAVAVRSAEQLMWRGCAALAMSDILEKAMYQTEIIAYDYGNARFFGNVPGLLQGTWIKRAGEPFDLTALVNGIAPWRFRTVSFGGFWLQTRHGLRPRSGYGPTNDILPDDLLRKMIGPGSDKIINMQNVWSENQAVQAATRYLNEISLARTDGREATNVS